MRIHMSNTQTDIHHTQSLTHAYTQTHTHTLERGWRIRLVDAFRPNGHGLDSRSIRHVGDLGQVLHSQLPVALRREIPAQYPCCVGTPPSSSGLEEAL